MNKCALGPVSVRIFGTALSSTAAAFAGLASLDLSA